MTYGRLVSAGTEIDGSELATDHSAGVTTLDLEDAFDFLEPEGGETFQVRIVADDGTEELATIKEATEDEETVIAEADDPADEGLILLAAPTVNAYDAGTRVEVYPQTKRIVAQVRLDDSEEDSETVDAVVHHTLYDRIPEGVDLNIAVEMDYDGETFYVVNILGEQPQVDGGFLSPGTIDYPALGDQVGSIRIVDSEADLADLDAKPGDAAYVRGEAGLYKYMDQQPSVSTYDGDGDPVLTPIDPVTATTNWYRTTDAADILANSITASHLQVETLSAIAADLGTVTAGSITGVTITGGTVQTATSGERVEMDSTNSNRIAFYNSSDELIGIILGASVSDYDLTLQSPDQTDGRVRLVAGSFLNSSIFDLTPDGIKLTDGFVDMEVRSTNPPAPASGFLRIYAFGTGGNIRMRQSNGDIYAVDRTLV